jgi:hypothetical protein
MAINIGWLESFEKLVTIAIAWIFYRPVLGILLLAAAGAAIFLLWKQKQEKKSAVVA